MAEKQAKPATALVGVIMGSQSDWPTMKRAADILEELGVPYEARIVSAHRTPDRLYDYAKTAASRGLKVIVGAQVGETSILARAGLVAVSAAGDALAGYEGGYGTHLLARDLTKRSLTIGTGGAFPSDALATITGPGLGLDLAPDAPLVETSFSRSR